MLFTLRQPAATASTGESLTTTISGSALMRMPTTVRPSDITGMISTTRSVSGVLMFESVSLTSEPVGVARLDRVVGVVVPAQDYEA